MTQTAAKAPVDVMRNAEPKAPPPTSWRPGMRLDSFEDYWRLANCIVQGGWGPKGITQEGAVVAMQYGAELGLDPIQAVQNIAVINGRPTLWGDALLAVCMKRRTIFDHGVFAEGFEGEGDTLMAFCIVGRIGAQPRRETFSVDDAKKAGLWGKGCYVTYPKRMLQMRARSFALRNTFPDILKGLYSTEEMAVDDVLDQLDLDTQTVKREPFDPEKMRKDLTKEPDPDSKPAPEPPPAPENETTTKGEPPPIEPKPKRRRSSKDVDAIRTQIIKTYNVLFKDDKARLLGQWGYELGTPIEVLYDPSQTADVLKKKLADIEKLTAEARGDPKEVALLYKAIQSYWSRVPTKKRDAIAKNHSVIELAELKSWKVPDLRNLRDDLQEAAKATA